MENFRRETETRFETVALGGAAVGDHETIERNGQTHTKEVVKNRLKCPTCSNFLIDEDDPLSVPGACWECSTAVCPNCGVDCVACEMTMCPTHSRGHGVEAEAYCNACRADVLDEQRFQRALELQKQRQKEVTAILSHRREYANQRRQRALDERKQLYDEQYKKTNLKLQFLKAVLEYKLTLGRAIARV